MRALIKVVLFCFVLFAQGALAEYYQFTELAKKTWIDPFTQSFLSDLVPKPLSYGDYSLEHVMRSIEHRTFRLKNRGSHHNEESEYILNVQAFTKSSAPDETILITTIHPKLYHVGNLIYPTPENAVGIWAMTIKDSETVNIEYLKFAPEFLQKHESAGMKVFSLYKKFLWNYQAKKDNIEAGWLGRYVWASSGYKLKRDYIVFENGRSHRQIELMRANFLRFCKYHGIYLFNLRNHKADILSLDLHELETPYDFTTIVDKGGRKISVSPYIDHEKLGPAQDMDIGKAFATMDYRPRTGQTIQVQVGGLPRSDIAMPPWHGVRGHRGCNDDL